MRKRKLNLLKDVDPARISLVDHGANHKTFFARKREDGQDEVVEAKDRDEGLIDLPSSNRLVKAEDWSAVYCVVAEPGWEENPGIGAPEPDVPDLWADEDEIRKAAHRFAKNGGLINAMHQGIEPYGQMVENYIVPSDFTLIAPDGTPQMIAKGSWVVVIEPNDAGREAIEKGEWTGVSLEGAGVRVAVEKADDKADDDPEPESNPGTFGERMNDRFTNFLRKIGVANGLSEEDLAELDAPLEKQAVTFAAIMSERTFEDELPDAFDALRSSVWRAFCPMDPSNAPDPKDSIAQSLEEFKQWALELLDTGPAEVKKLGDHLAEQDEADAALAKAELELAVIGKDGEVNKADADVREEWMAMSAADLDAAADEMDAITKASRSFASASRRKYAKQGIAMKDGSFPIPDTDALKRAMKAVGRAKKSKAGAVKAHIRRRAKALGATSMLTTAFQKGAPDETSGSVDSEMGLTTDEREVLDGLNKAVEELPDKLAESIAKAIKPAEGSGTNSDEDEAGKVEKGEKPEKSETEGEGKDSELANAVADLTKKVEKLGEGKSTVEEFDPEDPKNIAKADRVKKAFEDRNLPPELVGLTASLADDLRSAA